MQERQLACFFGLSFLLHLCSALLFAAYADRAMIKYHKEVLYIDLSRSFMPSLTRSEGKAGKEAVKKPERAPVTATPVKMEQPSRPAKAALPPMRQTVISDSAKPAPTTNAEQVSAASQGNPQPSTAREAGPQIQGSASATATGGQPANFGPVGEVAFGSASGPSFLRRILPIYPKVARRFNREGQVILRLTIDAAGSLVAVEVLEDPGYGFAAAAVDAVRRSRFLPARHEGKPVVAKALLPVRFTLQGIN
jgi:protein TonB